MKICVVLLLCFTTLPIWAFDVKGLKSGMTLEAFNQVNPDAPCAPILINGDTVCRYGTSMFSHDNPAIPSRFATIGDQPVKHLKLTIVNGKIGSVEAEFPRLSFSELLTALSRKYGKSETLGSIGVIWSSKTAMMILNVSSGVSQLQWSDTATMAPIDKKNVEKGTKDL